MIELYSFQMKPSQLYIILLTAGVVLCGEPEEYQVAPCKSIEKNDDDTFVSGSIMAILSGRRVESEYCNLKMLLIRQLQTQSLNNPELAPYLRAQSEKRSYIPLPSK